MAVNKPKVSGELLLSIGENGSFPVISLPEVGWCLATAATKTSYEVEGKTFLCTSPKAYTGKEFAQALTNGLGVDVKYVDISNDIDNVVANNVKNGWPEWEARGILDLYGLGKMGYLQPADGMKLLTGSEGMSLEELVEKYKDAF